MGRWSGRLTYANVTATAALFLALSGGVVYAAGKIGSRDIARNAIASKHVKPDALKTIAQVSHTLDEMLNRAPDRHAPYVGDAAFTTKTGIHASAILKNPATYEHVAPETVGNKRKVLVSDQAGRSNVLAELDRIGVARVVGHDHLGHQDSARRRHEGGGEEVRKVALAEQAGVGREDCAGHARHSDRHHRK